MVTGTTFATNSALYWVSFAVLIVVTAVTSFGGIKKVSKVTDVLVPIMAVVYVLTVVVLVLCNFTRVPWFFAAIFTQAFKPAAVFGGAFGIALSQGIKRGLMSNEAGQGTITMPAAAADTAPVSYTHLNFSARGVVCLPGGPRRDSWWTTQKGSF